MAVKVGLSVGLLVILASSVVSRWYEWWELKLGAADMLSQSDSTRVNASGNFYVSNANRNNAKVLKLLTIDSVAKLSARFSVNYNVSQF